MHKSASDNTKAVHKKIDQETVNQTFGDLEVAELNELISAAKIIKSRRPFSPELSGRTLLFQPTPGQ